MPPPRPSPLDPALDDAAEAISWFATLMHAVARSRFYEASRARDKLRDLGVDVHFPRLKAQANGRRTKGGKRA